MSSSRHYLEYHFNRNPKTIKNNYYKLDALVKGLLFFNYEVWTIVYFEKVPRYCEAVYMVAEYLKANYDYIQTLPYSKFEQCDVQFDVYKMGVDFKVT